jgi:hypothetical protein
MDDNILRCSFCNKEQDQVELLIGGPGHLYICSECVDLCNEVIEGARAGSQSAARFMAANAGCAIVLVGLSNSLGGRIGSPSDLRCCG